MDPNTMDYEKIGALIASKRKEKGLTQRQLAQMLGVTDQAVSKWERAKSFPDVSLLKPLCAVLGISVGELIEGEIRQETMLTKGAADRTTIKGMELYIRSLKKEEKIRLLTAAFLLLCVLAGSCGIWYSLQPVDLKGGNYEIGNIEMRLEDGSTRSFQLEGVYADETRRILKRILADAEGQWTEGDDNGPCYIRIEGLGTFYAHAYLDEKNGKKYPYYEIWFDRLFHLLLHYSEDLAYRGNEKEVYRYRNRSLTVSAALTEKPQELIVRDLFDWIKHDIKGFPEIYTRFIELKSIERLTEAQCRKAFEAAEGGFESVQKEMEYHEFYDCRFYKAVCETTYSEAKKGKAQTPDGLVYIYYLVGDNVDGDGYRIFYQTMPKGLAV